MIRRWIRVGVLGGLLTLAATVMLAWTQLWYSLALETGPLVEVLGSDAAGSLAALSLTLFALVAAFALASVVVRRFLGLVAAFVGGAVVAVIVGTQSDPVGASAESITEVTAVSGVESLRELVTVVDATVWPVVGMSAGVLIVAVGCFATITAPLWPSATKKYDRDPSVSATDPASQWDAQSQGLDPTNV